MASAATLYGLGDGFPGTLYTIDPGTGAATKVADVPGFASLTGLEALNGTLYATDVSTDDFNQNFGTIDPATGAYNPIAFVSINAWGLAANPVANLLYTIDGDNNNTLTSITPTGVTATIGTGGNPAITGLAFNGTLYGVGAGALYTIDTTTGVASAVGALGISGSDQYGLTFLGSTLYLNSTEGFLYTVNTATGAATLIGPNGVTGITGLAALDVTTPPSEVPEPSTLMVCGAALTGVLLRRFRQQ